MLVGSGKTEYRFPIQNNQETEQKIQSWLSVNQFQKMQEGDIVYYRGGDAIVGRRFFEYSINGDQVAIYAYLGSFQKPIALSDGIAGAMAIIPYRNALEPLLVALGSNTQSSQPQQSATQVTQQNTYGEFRQANEKRNNNYAEISFWVSILMLVVSFAGIAVGAIIVIFNYYLAAQGLKSGKKGKAIAAIVLSSIAIAIMIIKLIIELSK
ncbi:hypothetical protein IKF43_02375 [Candidatus Saccharibacteria bacterium]|nr:hypothetical protein [Candidatus Saccharibacteria bacterium]